MTEDVFQRALDADPTDWRMRLVFADWLEEQGDNRAAGYRWMGENRKYPSPPGFSPDGYGENDHDKHNKYWYGFALFRSPWPEKKCRQFRRGEKKCRGAVRPEMPFWRAGHARWELL